MQDRVASDSTLVLGNVVVAGHRTSVRLEPAIWDALQDILQREAKTLSQLVTEIDRARTASSLTGSNSRLCREVLSGYHTRTNNLLKNPAKLVGSTSARIPV
jgi:predicted DNA-binding ribbon-helix-helix protein